MNIMLSSRHFHVNPGTWWDFRYPDVALARLRKQRVRDAGEFKRNGDETEAASSLMRSGCFTGLGGMSALLSMRSRARCFLNDYKSTICTRNQYEKAWPKPRLLFEPSAVPFPEFSAEPPSEPSSDSCSAPLCEPLSAKCSSLLLIPPPQDVQTSRVRHNSSKLKIFLMSICCSLLNFSNRSTCLRLLAISGFVLKLYFSVPCIYHMRLFPVLAMHMKTYKKKASLLSMNIILLSPLKSKGTVLFSANIVIHIPSQI